MTGPPGAGKSTLVDAMVALLRKARVGGRPAFSFQLSAVAGRTRVPLKADRRKLKAPPAVGVLAVDPSSPFTGGALLGDRIRMSRHATDPGVFIRSLATRGALGGIARAVWDAADLLDAAGHGVILVETVGVGQSEIEVAQGVDATVVVLSPESGDGIQAMKSGLLEVADLLVVNKSDRPGAGILREELVAAYRLGPPRRRETPVLLARAQDGDGVKEILQTLSSRLAAASADGSFAERRARNAATRLRAIVEGRLRRDLWTDPRRQARLRTEAEAVASGRRGPYAAADRLRHP